MVHSVWNKIFGILSFYKLNVFFAAFISGENIFEIDTDAIAKLND